MNKFENTSRLSDLEFYYMPEDGPFEKYINYIKTLPLLDEAEAFGQHPNSEMLYRIQVGESMLKCLSRFSGDTMVHQEGDLEHQVIFYSFYVDTFGLFKVESLICVHFGR